MRFPLPMFLQIPVALLIIVLGTLEIAGGVQELVYQGIISNHRYPLISGMLGVVAGVLLLAAGIALLIRFQLTNVFSYAAA
jgi:uncharacterized membrane protein HdeD (DUF308 family)